ncbi:MAG: hypothetical protein EXR67_01960 [Dehalococcoidia bacterium]|nr:hypothetical protein [Dehalococcoidia bacterium]
MTIGILPDNNPADANPHILIPICTGMGYARNIIVVKSGRAVIAIEGAYGTLSGIAHALGDGIPVIGLDTWEFKGKGRINIKLLPAADPADAVAKALALARTGRQKRLAPFPTTTPPKQKAPIRTKPTKKA